jgi:ElaB/YqjD/DUF883 family membrane-anchored ribosome-binding protein
MVSREELRSHWTVVKNRLLHQWHELTDTELANFSGTPSQLISAIQKRTGASWNEVESFLTDVMRDGRSASQRASGLAEQYGAEVSQRAREGYDQLACATADYSKKVARTVQRRPLESLAVAFGVGLIAGAIVLFSQRRR